MLYAIAMGQITRTRMVKIHSVLNNVGPYADNGYAYVIRQTEESLCIKSSV